MMERRLVRAGEGDAADARIGEQDACRSGRHRPAGSAEPRAVRPPCAEAARRACATSGVCSAGLAMTALPAASAAATWPVKIASGKFHGLMQAKTPRPCSESSLRSPVGPGSSMGRVKLAPRLLRVVAQEIDRLAQVGDCALSSVLPASRMSSAIKAGRLGLVEIGGALRESRRAPRRRAGPRLPAPCPASAKCLARPRPRSASSTRRP